MNVSNAPAGRSDPFAAILPALGSGARGLRDRTAYITAGLVLAMTVVPAVLLWSLVVGSSAPRATTWLVDDVFDTGDPFAGAAFETTFTGGAAVAIATMLASALLLLGYAWLWMAVSVRAASVERGEPMAAWSSVTTGFSRLWVAVGAWLLVALAAIPLLIVYLLAALMARVVVLSFVSVVLTVALMIAIFVWVLVMLLVTWTIAAFAAGDHQAKVTTVLSRAVGLAVTNPVAVVTLLIGTSVVAGLTTYLLLGPAALAIASGLSISTVMASADHGLSAGLLGAFVALFAVALMLVPLVFTASTLTGFAVQAADELDHIEAAGRDARKTLANRLRSPKRPEEDTAGAPPPSDTPLSDTPPSPPDDQGQTPPTPGGPPA